jgi:hypothetical protein
MRYTVNLDQAPPAYHLPPGPGYPDRAGAEGPTHPGDTHQQMPQTDPHTILTNGANGAYCLHLGTKRESTHWVNTFYNWATRQNGRFAVNGTVFGPAFHHQCRTGVNDTLFPHVLSKNMRYTVNLDQAPPAYHLPPGPGYPDRAGAEGPTHPGDTHQQNPFGCTVMKTNELVNAPIK